VGGRSGGGRIVLAIVTFAFILVLAVLLSELAERTVLSLSVLFLVAGFLVGKGMLGLVLAEDPVVERLADLALFSTLFTDGMRVRFRDLVHGWRLPARALLLGLPLTLGVTALLARYLVGLPWTAAFLVGTVLSPTDPVFASAIVGRKDIPFRLRHLLNIESGLNDGLALPVVLVLLAVLGSGKVGILHLLGELAGGLALGVAVPWIISLVERVRILAVARSYQPLFAVAVALLVYTLANWLHVNEYLASFAAGITLGNVRPRQAEESHTFAENLAELFKLAALLLFGAMISPHFLGEIGAGGYVFAVLALLLARPIGLGVALLGSPLGWREELTALWFGPRGFASVVYGLLVLRSGVHDTTEMFHLIALVVAFSIVAHSSTDIVMARWLRGEGAGSADDTESGQAEPAPDHSVNACS
jgi:NhaP-type Na+/H+ or K+/H+ antiporter